MISESQMTPSGWWWLSFADARRPIDEQFLGVAIVQGTNMVDAVRNAHRLRCNPGGEVQGLSIVVGRVPSDPWRNRLLTKGEALEIKAWSDAKWPRPQQ